MPRKVDPLAGRYYRVTPRFWQDRDVRGWPEDVRFLALYMMTCPHRNMIGLFYCPVSYMEADLQWDGARMKRAFAGLIRVGFVEYDIESQIVFIVNLLKNDPLVNPNQAQSAIKTIRALPITHLVRRLYEEAQDHCPVLAAHIEDQLPTVVSEVEYARNMGSTVVTETRKPYTVSRINNNAQNDAQVEDEQVDVETTKADNTPPLEAVDLSKKFLTKKQIELAAADKLAAEMGLADAGRKRRYTKQTTDDKDDPLMAGFTEFWNAYPRRRDKGRAERCWLARMRDKKQPVRPEELILAASLFAAECAARGKDMEYVMYPARFIGPDRVYQEYLQPIPTAGGSTVDPMEMAQRAAKVAQEKTSKWMEDILAKDPRKREEE